MYILINYLYTPTQQDLAFCTNPYQFAFYLYSYLSTVAHISSGINPPTLSPRYVISTLGPRASRWKEHMKAIADLQSIFYYKSYPWPLCPIPFISHDRNEMELVHLVQRFRIVLYTRVIQDDLEPWEPRTNSTRLSEKIPDYFSLATPRTE